MQRRQLLQFIGLATFLMLARKNKAFALAYHSEGTEWARDIRFHSEELLRGRISSRDWQVAIDQVFSHLPLADLLKDLDFDAVQEEMFIGGERETWFHTVIPGLTKKDKIYTKIVGLRKDRSIPPHGHENEASVFMTLQGSLRLRQWDKIATRNDSLDILPVYDGITQIGEWNSQSDLKSNIHWLHALSDEARLLSVRVAKIDGTSGGRTRIPIDPEGGQELGGGIIRAPIMNFDVWWRHFH